MGVGDVSVQCSVCILLVPRQTEPPTRRVEVELRLNIRKQFIAITRFHINTKTETFVKIEKK